MSGVLDRTTGMVAACGALRAFLRPAGAAHGVEGDAVAFARHDGAGRVLGAIERGADLVIGRLGVGDREGREDGHGGTDEQHDVRLQMAFLSPRCC